MTGIRTDCDRRGLWGLRAARLFDGQMLHSGFPLVLVDGSRVVGMDVSGARPSSSLPVTDLGDVTMLPGLVDAHVHLTFDAANTAKQTMAEMNVAALWAVVRANADRQLRAGVTTVRDLGDRDYLAVALRTAYAAADEIGPEILAAGPPITRVGGHCWFLGGEADGIAGIRAAVADRVAHGVDLVKIMATGGAVTPSWAPHESQYTRAELTEATRAAHESGRPITAHAHGVRGIADAVAAGVDGIEHGSFFTEDGVDADWATVAAMAEAGTWVGATEAWLPEGVMLAPHLADRLERRSENFARMHREGVRLVCCSDAGAGPRKPHGVLPRGIIHFGTMGLSSTEALAAATALAAHACGLGDRKGRIAAGYDADILAVAGNPMQDLTHLLQVRAVFRAGHPVLPESPGRLAISSKIGGPR